MVLPFWNSDRERQGVSGWFLLHWRANQQSSLLRRHVFCDGRLNICRNVLGMYRGQICARGVLRLYQVRPWNHRSRFGHSNLRQLQAWLVYRV